MQLRSLTAGAAALLLLSTFSAAAPTPTPDEHATTGALESRTAKVLTIKECKAQGGWTGCSQKPRKRVCFANRNRKVVSIGDLKGSKVVCRPYHPYAGLWRPGGPMPKGLSTPKRSVGGEEEAQAEEAPILETRRNILSINMNTCRARKGREVCYIGRPSCSVFDGMSMFIYYPLTDSKKKCKRFGKKTGKRDEDAEQDEADFEEAELEEAELEDAEAEDADVGEEADFGNYDE